MPHSAPRTATLLHPKSRRGARWRRPPPRLRAVHRASGAVCGEGNQPTPCSTGGPARCGCAAEPTAGQGAAGWPAPVGLESLLALEPLLALAPLVAASGDAPPDVAPLSRLSRRVGRALCGGAGGQRGVGRRGGEGERRRGREEERERGCEGAPGEADCPDGERWRRVRLAGPELLQSRRRARLECTRGCAQHTGTPLGLCATCLGTLIILSSRSTGPPQVYWARLTSRCSKPGGSVPPPKSLRGPRGTE